MDNLKTYMIIPVYDTVILPDVDYQLGTEPFESEELSRLKIDGNKAVLLPLKAPVTRGEVNVDSFFGAGVLADIVSIQKTHAGTRVHCQTREKVQIADVSLFDSILEGRFYTRDEVSDITEKGEKELLDSLKKTITELTKHFQGAELALTYIQRCSSINEFGAMFCPFIDMTLEEKYQLLETDSLRERGLMIKDALMRFQGTIRMQEDLNTRYNETEGNSYKKAAIRKQIGLLQDELDAMDPEGKQEEDDYQSKIEASGMPEEARKEVDRVLKRYLDAQPNDPERSTMENYLDFVTALKWRIDDTKPADLKKARRILNRDHYGLDKVKERILEHIAVMTLKNEQAGSILLFVGAPGTGKTSMGHSIADALDRKYVRISLGGVRDEAEIRGHRRTYVGAMPGRIMDGIKRSGSMNPVVVLDEVDKLMAGGFSGDPSSALLEVLDPEQNNTFTDHYMNIPYDLSNVLFICTANTTDTIPQPLLDRMEVIQLSGYTPVDKVHIARKHLLPAAMRDTGLQKGELKVTDGAIRRIVSEYTMEAGVRGLKKQLDRLCRHVAADFVENGHHPVTVTGKEVPEMLGNKGIIHDRIQKSNPPGVVTGLAWTQAGGEILFIESTAMHGSGHVLLTGQLGDVMKESAEIASSLVRSLFISDKLDFKDKDIHIHVPSGAVPKDGPSAGVTMFTALVSLVTGKSVAPDLAMTGEISLRGNVLPIGGLPEKLMAAQRAGVKKVLIPRENQRDLTDVPDEVKKTLEIVPVDTVNDVIRHALGIELPAMNTNLFAAAPAGTEQKG